MKRSGRWIAILLVIAAAAGVPLARSFHRHELSARVHAQAGKELYYCPMHPMVTSSKPGNCTICGMRLVRREKEDLKGKQPEEICILHNCAKGHDGMPCPMMVIAKPGEEVTCPICGTHVVEGTVSASAGAASPLGYAAILLSPQKQQMIGVSTAPVMKSRVVKTIRTVGRVMTDETKVIHVHPKVEGWVDQIYAKYEGDKVTKGQPLFSFYSPDFVASQQEYVGALNAVKETLAHENAEIRSAAEATLEAARQRLRWWDVSDDQIRELETRGTPSKTLLLVSPIDGVVLKKSVLAGQFMERGGDFYRLADLSTVWVDADLYEYDLPLVAVGQQAMVTLPNISGARMTGTVVYLSPFLKPETRTATARLELANKDGMLRPDMFATVEIQVDLGEQLVVPEEAVFDTGTRKILFVAKGEGIFEPREVAVGAKGDGVVVVQQGVSEGEPVVTSGNFLIDSESRLKSALTSMESGGHSHAP